MGSLRLKQQCQSKSRTSAGRAAFHTDALVAEKACSANLVLCSLNNIFGAAA